MTIINIVKNKIIGGIIWVIGNTHWNKLRTKMKGQYFDLTPDELNVLRVKLAKDYYIILTRRKTHFSTYAINFTHWVLSKFTKWGYYSHALMNTEDEVQTDEDFRLMEATNTHGVAYTSFDKVFDCDSVALLKPKGITIDDWTKALDKLKTYEGRQYDTLYDLQDDTQLSCVELVRASLRGMPNYDVLFAPFEEKIKSNKNLDPQMFYECDCFEVEYEIRH